LTIFVVARGGGHAPRRTHLGGNGAAARSAAAEERLLRLRHRDFSFGV